MARRRARRARRALTRKPPTAFMNKGIQNWGHIPSGRHPYRRETSWGLFAQSFGRRLRPSQRTAIMRVPGKPRRTINRLRMRRDVRGRFR
jgi:hypothetical protein